MNSGNFKEMGFTSKEQTFVDNDGTRSQALFGQMMLKDRLVHFWCF